MRAPAERRRGCTASRSEIVVARRLDEVVPALEQVRARVAAGRACGGVAGL